MGLLPDNSSDGSGSRVVIDPVDPTKAIYAGADGDLHLLSGIRFTPGSNPCNQQSTITDTNISAQAFPVGSQYATGVGAFPDWSPDGQNVVFNSTRGEATRCSSSTTRREPHPRATLLSPPRPLAARRPANSGNPSPPRHRHRLLLQSRKGSTVYSEMLIPETNGTWQASDMEDLSAQDTTGISFDSEPGLAQLIVSPVMGEVPESPYLPALPRGRPVV